MVATISAVRAQELLHDYSIYDEHVDIVSIFHWLMRDTEQLPATVRYFDRFPCIKQGGKSLTPDFTVLFNDGYAIIGEIASVAVHENSIDKLVGQLCNYHAISEVPASEAATAVPTHLDVLLLVPSDRGQSAFNRIQNRARDPLHAYKPKTPLVVAEYVRTADMYIVKRLQNADNGDLNPGDREHHLSIMLNNDFHPRASYFTGIKTEFRFINDEPSTLYLATHLLQQTLPTEYASTSDEVDVTPPGIADLLRKQYGGGVKASHVKRALGLLQKAGFASPSSEDSSWRVSLKRPRSTKSSNQVHEIIVERACRRVRSMLAPRHERPPQSAYGQDRLFGDI